MIKAILYCILTAAFVLAAVVSAGDIFWLIDPASGFIVIAGTAALLYIAFPARDWGRAVAFIFSGAKVLPAPEQRRLIGVYRASGEFFIYCGVLGTFIGFVLLLQIMDDPDTIFPMLAVAVITIVYSVVLYMLSLFLRRKASLCETVEEQATFEPRNTRISFAVGLVIYLIVIILGIQTSGSVVSFIDPGSVLLVAGGSIFACLLLSRPGDLAMALKAAFSGDELSREGASTALKTLEQVSDIVLGMSILALMVSFIFMLGNNLEPRTLGPLMALAMISFLYALVLISLVRSLGYAIRRKAGFQPTVKGDSRYFRTGFILLYGILISFLLWGILFHAIDFRAVGV